MKRCKECGKEFSDDRLFCDSDGTPLERDRGAEKKTPQFCSRCGAPAAMEFKFCKKCGSPLSTYSPPSQSKKEGGTDSVGPVVGGYGGSPTAKNEAIGQRNTGPDPVDDKFLPIDMDGQIKQNGLSGEDGEKEESVGPSVTKIGWWKKVLLSRRGRIIAISGSVVLLLIVAGYVVWSRLPSPKLPPLEETAGERPVRPGQPPDKPAAPESEPAESAKKEQGGDRPPVTGGEPRTTTRRRSEPTADNIREKSQDGHPSGKSFAPRSRDDL